MNKINNNHDVNNYLKMAKSGHMPLFFKEWITNGTESKNNIKINYSNASKNVHEVFKELSKHRTLSKMQTALISMPKKKRDTFTNSFLKMVEYTTLKEVQLLQ